MYSLEVAVPQACEQLEGRDFLRFVHCCVPLTQCLAQSSCSVTIVEEVNISFGLELLMDSLEPSQTPALPSQVELLAREINTLTLTM